ncbi:hypothetical protein DFH09DRAFT_1283536, partial [Mycena vulgaris]
MTPSKTAARPAPATQSKADKLANVATTSLEVGIKILGLLSDVTKDVPYLGAITSCIQKLINIRKSMKHNKEHSEALLNSIWEVSGVLAAGLQSMNPQSQTTAAHLLKNDLQKYQIVLTETCRILEEWTSKGFVKRLWSQGDFPDIANSISHRVNTFRDVFSVSRLIALSEGQDVIHGILQILVNDQTRTRLDKWLGPPADVAKSHRNAANTCHPKTGLWLPE